MMIILILLLVSAIISFMIAPKHNIEMVVVSSLILALTVAMVAWRGDFGLLPGIAITFACVTVSQFAYLLRLWLSTHANHNSPAFPNIEQHQPDSAWTRKGRLWSIR